MRRRPPLLPAIPAVTLLLLAALLAMRLRRTGSGTGTATVLRPEDEAPLWAVDVTQSEGWRVFAAGDRKMPDKPLKNQKRPPCDPADEEEVNGGCWIMVARLPPCSARTFEKGGRCYMPAAAPPVVPTSIGQ